MQPIVAVAVPSILSAAAVATVAVRWTRRPIAPKRRGGFNCCEDCGRELPRHPQQTWRYDGTCSRCGHVQAWATPSSAPQHVSAPVQERPSPMPAPTRVAEEPIAGIAAAAAEI